METRYPKARPRASAPAPGPVAAGAGLPRANARRSPPRTQGEDTGGQRARILQVATQLFAAQGYTNTTMAQIADELGVTKPFIYYYFRDKQEIFEVLSWAPAVDCFTVLDFAEDDTRCASEKVMDGLRRLIAATIAHHPVAFFPYREPQVYRPEYLAAQKELAHHFYDRLCPLLEQARRDGDLDFRETKITALAACSLPGFLYNWYRPGGRLSPDEMVDELTELAARVVGLRRAGTVA